MSVRLLPGDCIATMRTLPANSVDAVVTDPPYHLLSTVKRFANSPRTESTMPKSEPHARMSVGFMGKTWDGGDIAFRPETWAEVLRVLKPGGHMVAFGAPKNAHRLTCAIEDAGFEIRDALMWLFGSGFPKSLDISKAIDKHLGAEREKVAPRSVIGHQRNIGNRRPYMDDPNHKTDSDDPASAAAAVWQGWGTALKPAYEPIILARKPIEGTNAENVLRFGVGGLNIDDCRVGTSKDVPASAAKDRIGQVAKGDERGRTMNTSGFDPNVGRWPANVIHDGIDEEWARYFYCAKANKTDRAGSKHPTVKPIALMRYLCRLITPSGGIILDPFAGSGTTGQAASEEGFNAILCERELEYVADINRRLGLEDALVGMLA